MHILLLARNLAILIACAFFYGTVAPVAAAEPSACHWDKANASLIAGDRYRTRQDHSRAARSYLAASRFTHGCRSVDASLLAARALAQAGTAYAQSGDYLRALSPLHAAQSHVMQPVIAAIGQVAQSAMRAAGAPGYR